jgi:hypothetical protein
MTINKLVIYNQQDREHEESTRWAVHANESPYINDCTNSSNYGYLDVKSKKITKVKRRFLGLRFPALYGATW